MVMVYRKFVVGQKVRCIDSISIPLIRDRSISIPLIRDRIYVIQEVKNSEPSIVIDGVSYFSYRFAPVNEKEEIKMSNFRVGDIVKCVSPTGNNKLRAYQLYEITRISNTGEFVDVRDIVTGNKSWGCDRDRFTLVTKVQDRAASDLFKIGDIVECVQGNDSYHPPSKMITGDKYRVIGFDNGFINVCHLKTGIDTEGWRPDRFKLIGRDDDSKMNYPRKLSGVYPRKGPNVPDLSKPHAIDVSALEEGDLVTLHTTYKVGKADQYSQVNVTPISPSPISRLYATTTYIGTVKKAPPKPLEIGDPVIDQLNQTGKIVGIDDGDAWIKLDKNGSKVERPLTALKLFKKDS